MKRLVKTSVICIAFLLLLAAGCGGGESAPETARDTSAPAQTTAASAEATGASTDAAGGETTAPSGLSVETVVIKTSDGEEVEVRAEIADDEAERRKGLMDRPEGSLPEGAGMLFVFGREKPLSFWMKDTLLPLSIAYVAESGRIVDIEDMEPLDTTSHPSAEPSKYALEVNQGFFAERGIKVGDAVELPEELR